MEKNKEVYSRISKQPIFDLAAPLSFVVLVSYFMISEKTIGVISACVLIASLVFLYFALLEIKKCFFLDDYIKIKYFFKIKKRYKIVYYDEIEKVRYIHAPTPQIEPFIDIVLKHIIQKKRSKIQISIDSKKQRKAILQLLHDKNIKIEIKSDFKGDDNIIDYN